MKSFYVKTALPAIILMAGLFFLIVSRSLTDEPVRQFYVNSQTGDDSNPGTSRGKAWKSLAPVNSMEFMPGDIVNFARGSSWTGELLISDSGEKDNPIIFRACGKGDRPVISNPAPANHVVSITGQWIIFDGFMIRDSHSAAIRLAEGADHNIIRNCRITNAGMGIGSWGSYNLFTRNYVHDLNMVVNTPKEVHPDDDHGAVAFWMFAPNNEISYNRAVNCRAPSYDYGHDGGFFEIWGNGDSTYVHHNWSENNDGFFEFGGNARIPGHGSSAGVVVAYNVCINSGRFGVMHFGEYFHNNTRGLRIENNTIIRTGTFPSLFWYGSVKLPEGTISFKNNIVVRGGEGQVVFTTHDFERENNIYYLIDGAMPGFEPNQSEIVADPLFRDFRNLDFRIKRGSPARGAGLELGHYHDLNGISLPKGTSPGIGAYEFRYLPRSGSRRPVDGS
jgi:hypothetical protein